MQKILHTPEGVRDIYSRECEQKLLLQQRLQGVIRSFGYRDIETPTFEFLDVFDKEVGSLPSRELFRFFDREGNTLVLRPDFTPSVARAASKYLISQGHPVRLTYLGNTFVNNMSYQGRQKESTQIGAELIGDGSVDSDAEVIALVVEALRAAGLTDFQISVGHAGYFRGLADAASLDNGLVQELKILISNKNLFGVEKLLSSLSADEHILRPFGELPRLFGGAEVLSRARALTAVPEALGAIDRLQQIWELLQDYGVQTCVSFDLGMLNGYDYYTGIVLRGYTYGTGDAVVKGGRYDGLLAHFGKNTPAVGFVTVVDQLQQALSRQNIHLPVPERHAMLLYDPDHRKEAVSRAMSLRRDGIEVELLLAQNPQELEQLRAYARKSGCSLVVELI